MAQGSLRTSASGATADLAKPHRIDRASVTQVNNSNVLLYTAPTDIQYATVLSGGLIQPSAGDPNYLSSAFILLSPPTGSVSEAEHIFFVLGGLFRLTAHSLGTLGGVVISPGERLSVRAVNAGSGGSSARKTTIVVAEFL